MTGHVMPQGMDRGSGRGGAAAGARALPLPPRAAGRTFAWPDIPRLFAAEVEARRLFLWLPVAFGAGVLLYFAADREPQFWAAPIAAVLALAAALAARRREAIAGFRVALACLFVALGFGASSLRTAMMAAPVLTRVQVAKVTAYVETVDDRRAGGRLLLRVLSIDGLDKAATPERLRVTTRARPGFSAGATIRATMRLLPPSRASEPGGYDFSRDAFFAGIGGVGSVVSRVEFAEAGDAPPVARFNAFVDRGRNALTDRIVAAVGPGFAPGDGAVAAALVTGKRGLIPEEANDALRAAGIYHVVSISGLHMVLAAGLFLWSFRAIFALFPGVALTRPLKKWGALFAIAGAIAYDVFSGSEVATERSLIMTLVILGAILVERPALSMRNLAIAALIVMAREPETLLGPSFQMSFAAVAALIAAFERRADDERTPKREPATPGQRLRARAGLVLFGMFVTTFVASLATDPYATFHFHRLTPYGLIGNALTLPLVEFLVMPAALIGVALAPFGLDAPVWMAMGWGVSAMMAVSRFVAALPGSTQYVPAFGAGALALMTAGIVWTTLWRTALRWAGPPLFLIGIAVAARAPQPDVVVDGQARSAAVRGADGRLHVLNARANLFGASQWLLADADSRPPREAGGDGRCDARGCVATLPDGRFFALVFDKRALPEDCGRAAIVVTRLWTNGLCQGPAVVLDAAHFEAHGATALRRDGAGFAAIPDRRPGYGRPWAPAPKAAAPAPSPAAASPAPEPDEQDPAPFLPQ